MKREGMAGATYTEASLEEWDTFLKRAFHALHPKQGSSMGEVTYDLFLTPKVGIRIRTTVPTEGAQTRKSGADIIQMIMYDFSKNRPLMPRDMILKVKRTQNWRDGVRDRIEKYMELFDEHEDAIEAGRFIDWHAKKPEPEAEPV
jgi:hypothetical protein